MEPRLFVGVFGFDLMLFLAGFAYPIVLSVDECMVVGAPAVVLRTQVAFHTDHSSPNFSRMFWVVRQHGGPCRPYLRNRMGSGAVSLRHPFRLPQIEPVIRMMTGVADRQAMDGRLDDRAKSYVSNFRLRMLIPCWGRFGLFRRGVGFKKNRRHPGLFQ